MGISLGFNVGPLRLSKSLKRSRRTVWRHEGCAIDHKTQQAANEHAAKLAAKRA